jgi:hypothetical protein
MEQKMTGWRKRQVDDMAKEVKMPYDFVTGEPINLEKLEAFAALVREDEREACAKVAEDMDAMVLALLNVTRQPIAIAAAIRARGQA